MICKLLQLSEVVKVDQSTFSVKVGESRLG